MADIVCKVVGQTGTAGTVYAEFPVNLETARLIGGGAKSGPGTASFTVHPLEPGLAALSKPYLGGRREIQLWQGGACRWWGIPLSMDLASMNEMRYRCIDLKFHLLRRFFGPIQNNYWSPNADFEDGLTNWTAVGTTATSVTDWRAMGTKSVKLVQAAAGTDSYLRRRHTTTTTTDPVFFAAKALLRLQNAGWVGPALDERGLYLELQQPAGTFYAAVKPEWAPITNHTERDSYEPQRLETGIIVPAGGTFTIEGRLYSPGGTAWWDHTALVTEESVGSDIGGDPADLIVTRIVQYAQDATAGKSPLNMPVNVVGGPAAELLRIYQFYRQGNILEALAEYVELSLLDWDVIWAADGSARTFQVWVGGRGAYVNAPLLFPGNAVEPFDWSADGSKVVTKGRRTGKGSGAVQEVFEAVDTSQMDGLTLESVQSAPSDATTDSLYGLAVADVDANRMPVERTGFRRPAADVFGVFGVGDSLDVLANYGPAIQVNAQRRVHHLDWEGDYVQVGWDE